MPDTMQLSRIGTHSAGSGTEQERPSRRKVLAATAALAGATMLPGAQAGAPPSPKLRRGGSIHTMMNWADLAPGSRNTFAWPPFSAPRFRTPAPFLRALARTGIDFIRITIDQGPFLQATGSRRAELDAILLRKCKLILDQGLDVIVDFHPVRQVAKYAPIEILRDINGQLFKHYTAMIAHAAGALRALDPARVALEPFNEPPYGYNFATAARWQNMMEIMHAAIRAKNPHIAVIWSGAKSADITGLFAVKPARFNDRNIFWSFHYYRPHHFTHQGVRTSYSHIAYYRYLSDLPYPAPLGNASLLQEIVEHNLMVDLSLTDIQRRAFLNQAMKTINGYMQSAFGPGDIRSDFDRVSDWADRNNIPPSRIFLGEFGVVRRSRGGNGPASRHRSAWLREVRLAAETRGFGWAIWDINQPQMGIVYKRDTDDFDLDMVRALGLRNPDTAG